ncbi:hypothetical protein JTB14_015437 [Gonioctena quinquepunctata]|nr:hypothetical protein JTB14_015437 [Gonioctena quinquepunctata]
MEEANKVNDFLINIPITLHSQSLNIPHTCDIIPHDILVFVFPITTDEILEAVNSLKNKFSSGDEDIPNIMGVFLDSSQAYDCIDYNIILQNLEKYGVRGPASNGHHH